MGDEELPHTRYSEFTEKKSRHTTGIRSSPRRAAGEDGGPPAQSYAHPYEPGQPDMPHWSQETFDTRKRAHATEIRSSPRRADGSQRYQAPLPAGGKDKHTSCREFAIEKGEHLTPVLPVREGAPPAEERDPQGFRHRSCDVLQREKMGHKTPLYPEMQHTGQARRGGTGVIDNFLNIRPHEPDFLHNSHETFKREKAGHLTAIHCSPRRGDDGTPQPPPAQPTQPASIDEPHRSAEQFIYKKTRHQTPIHSSPPRGGGGEGRSPSAGDVSAARSRSPPGCFQSQGKFKSAKNKHATPINPVYAAQSPPPAGESAEGGGGKTDSSRQGYASHTHFSVDKKKHVAAVDNRRRAAGGVSDGGHSPSASVQRAHGECAHPPGDVHKSHTEFTEDKTRHLTNIRQSPRRNSRGGNAAAGTPSPGGRTFTSFRDLQRAKRGHQTVLGAGSPSPGGPQGAASPDPAPHSSHKLFQQEKRGHSTSIRASPPRGGGAAASPQPGRDSGGPQHTSYRQFCSEKSKHRADIYSSPARPPGSAQRGGASPEVITSHHHFSQEKSKHSYEMDSPRRAQRSAPPPAISPQVPPSGSRTPASEQRAPSAPVESERRSSRASGSRGGPMF